MSRSRLPRERAGNASGVNNSILGTPRDDFIKYSRENLRLPFLIIKWNTPRELPEDMVEEPRLFDPFYMIEIARCRTISSYELQREWNKEVRHDLETSKRQKNVGRLQKFLAENSLIALLVHGLEDFSPSSG